MSQFLSKILVPKWGNISKRRVLLIDPKADAELAEIMKDKISNPGNSVALRIKELLVGKNDLGPRD